MRAAAKAAAARDILVWAPNVLGLGSAATQLLLILRFGRTPKSNR